MVRRLKRFLERLLQAVRWGNIVEMIQQEEQTNAVT